MRMGARMRFMGPLISTWCCNLGKLNNIPVYISKTKTTAIGRITKAFNFPTTVPAASGNRLALYSRGNASHCD